MDLIKTSTKINDDSTPMPACVKCSLKSAKNLPPNPACLRCSGVQPNFENLLEQQRNQLDLLVQQQKQLDLLVQQQKQLDLLSDSKMNSSKAGKPYLTITHQDGRVEQRYETTYVAITYPDGRVEESSTSLNYNKPARDVHDVVSILSAYEGIFKAETNFLIDSLLSEGAIDNLKKLSIDNKDLVGRYLDVLKSIWEIELSELLHQMFLKLDLKKEISPIKLEKKRVRVRVGKTDDKSTGSENSEDDTCTASDNSEEDTCTESENSEDDP